MVSQNNPDEYDPWQGNFAPDESLHTNDDESQYQPFFPLTAADALAGSTLSDTFSHDDQSDLSGANSSPFLLARDYELRFGPPPPQAPQAPAPSLDIEDLVNFLAVYPEGAPAPGPEVPASEQPVSIHAMGSGPMQIPTSYPSHANIVPFGGTLMSASVPGSLYGSQTPMYPDAHRARSSSYAGPAQTPYHHSIPPSAFHTPPNLGVNGTFHIEFQETSRGPPTLMPLAGPTQHVLQFNSDGHEHDHPDLPPTVQPYSIPLPASPSEDSSPASSPTLSPATSTSSLAYPPSPSTSRTETFRWRLNSHDDQGWKCECESKAKKRKRHLESCPNNPNKPRIICPHCPQPFTGGSRRSALSKHLSNIHGRSKPDGSNRKKKDKRR